MAPSRSSVVRLVLSAVLLFALPSSQAASVLDPVGIYGSLQDAQRCLNVIWQVGLIVLRTTEAPGAAANCLRFAFHDAGTYLTSTDVGGANGSILFELNITEHRQSNGLQLCGSLMPVIINLVRLLGCPAVTNADVVQVVGAVAVALTRGPACPLLMGRPDQLNADNTEPLPGNPCDTAEDMVAAFGAMGFDDPVEAAVVLLGAHNIGNSRVSRASSCSPGLGPMTAAPRLFDGHYYSEVVFQTGKQGFFQSDRALNAPNASTAELMVEYANNHTAWLADWCEFAQELSLLGVDPVPAGFTVRDGWAPPAFLAPTVAISSGNAAVNVVQDIIGSLPSVAEGLGLDRLPPGLPESIPVPLPMLAQLLSAFVSSFTAVGGRQGPSSAAPGPRSADPFARAPAY